MQFTFDLFLIARRYSRAFFSRSSNEIWAEVRAIAHSKWEDINCIALTKLWGNIKIFLRDMHSARAQGDCDCVRIDEKYLVWKQIRISSLPPHNFQIPFYWHCSWCFDELYCFWRLLLLLFSELATTSIKFVIFSGLDFDLNLANILFCGILHNRL